MGVVEARDNVSSAVHDDDWGLKGTCQPNGMLVHTAEEGRNRADKIKDSSMSAAAPAVFQCSDSARQ